MGETPVLSPLPYTTIIAFWRSLSVTVEAALHNVFSVRQRNDVGGVPQSDRASSWRIAVAFHAMNAEEEEIETPVEFKSCWWWQRCRMTREHEE